MIEARTKRLAKDVSRKPMHAAPLTVEGLVADAELRGNDPGTGDVRAAYAAELVRLGEAILWPPGRNEPCWCGSGRTYEQCCGPVPVAEIA